MNTSQFYTFLSLFGILAMCGCNDAQEKADRDAYIGGRIINPTSEFVVILKDNNPIDTAYLDHKNRFELTIENIDCGFYAFEHLPEMQNLYLQAGDSLLIRVNSLQFDESLHFSGSGSEKNNFLMETFLNSEKNSDLLLSYHKVNPDEFFRKTDSIKKKQLEQLGKLNKKYKFSDDFINFAEKSLEYDIYDLRERYTYMVNKYYKKFSRELSEDFHAYRKKVDFNDATMQSSPNYARFIDSHLINRAMGECATANLDSNDCYDLYDHENITTRIKLIDTITSLPLIKEHFFSKLGALGIVVAKEREEIVAVLDLLNKEGYPKENLQQLYNIGNIQIGYLPGRNVNETPLFDTSGNKKLYSEITRQPTVVFLWSIFNPENHKKNHRIINDLRKKYPEVKFIGVNIDSEENLKWKETIARYGYDPTNEYQLGDINMGPDAFRYYLNKSLFIDASGVVIKGNAYINSPGFESKVLEFLNR